MPTCHFVSDLHGSAERYLKLFHLIAHETPDALFLGGDLLPSGLGAPRSLEWSDLDFFDGFLLRHLRRLRRRLAGAYPRVFAILGNDDCRSQESSILAAAAEGLLEYIHERSLPWGPYRVYGYAAVPPSPFLLKDWERYDVSRYVDPGCISPEEGQRTVPVAENKIRYGTIAQDLEQLLGLAPIADGIVLFHAPPHQTALDRAALDGRKIDHAPLDVHVGSVAIRRAIERVQPLLTLHGHIHESARLSGAWRDRIGRTHCFSAAHDGPELALVAFDPQNADEAQRRLL